MAQLKFSNREGIPNLEVVSVTSDGTNTTLSFNPHPYRLTNRFFGGFWVKVPNAVTTSTQPLFVNTIGVSGSSYPVYDITGAAATVAAIASSGPVVHEFFYDRDNDRVQIIR